MKASLTHMWKLLSVKSFYCIWTFPINSKCSSARGQTIKRLLFQDCDSVISSHWQWPFLLLLLIYVWLPYLKRKKYRNTSTLITRCEMSICPPWTVAGWENVSTGPVHAVKASKTQIAFIQETHLLPGEHIPFKGGGQVRSYLPHSAPNQEARQCSSTHLIHYEYCRQIFYCPGLFIKDFTSVCLWS